MMKYLFRKLCLSTFLAFTLLGSTSAQEVTMHDVFKLMPDTIVPYLTEVNRLDFLDFMDSGMTAEVTNSLGGKSRMLQLTSRYTAVKLSEASVLELCLLPVSIPVDSASQIVCVVRTYGDDICESTVEFYSLQWRKLPTADYLKLPTADYLNLPTADYLNLPVGTMVRASLDGEEQPTLTLTPETYFDAPANEEQKKVEKVLTKLKWSDGFVIKL